MHVALQALRKPKLLICCLLVALFVIAFGACAFFRVTRLSDVAAYRGMGSGVIHPVWREFAFRRFGRGDSVAALLNRYTPSEVEEFGNYGVYTYYARYDGPEYLYFCGLVVIAKDGKITDARAWTCTWEFSFFETDDPTRDYEYSKYIDQKSIANLEHDQFRMSPAEK